MQIDFSPDLNIFKLDNVAVSLHCHHYNCGLIKAIEEIEGIEPYSVIVRAAQEEFYFNFKNYITNNLSKENADEQMKVAVELYKFMGFGIIDVSELSETGGRVYSNSSYYVTGWLAKYGRRKEPVCYITCGFISGILSAIYKKSIDSYAVHETNCMISGSERCEFVIKLREQCQ